MSFLNDVPREVNRQFMAAHPDYTTARTVILGVPMDETSTYRRGSRQGPQQIRLLSDALEEFSFPRKRDLREVPFFDAGDLQLPFGNVPRSLDITRRAVQALLKDKKMPVILGGEHLLTVPVVQAFLERFPDLVVLHFDAHADLRKHYRGEVYSHASVIYRLLESGVQEIYQFGIRSAEAEEVSLARERTYFYPFKIIQPLQECRKRLQNRPIYITTDIDVIDPAFAPGTGTPEPGGCTAAEFLAVFEVLDGLTVVGFDLVEVSPPFDPAQVTALLAAKIVREAILTFT